jgi:D-alanyl-D-alanine carboxypeptidase/D-alanyl-D-alanine-endopeptidase (penicillin-binding protein 4)
VAGVDPSMHKRLKDPMFKDNVWAKSGYINNVSTFSGYLKAKSGKMIAFSILINKSRYSNTNNIDLQDKVCAELMKGL